MKRYVYELSVAGRELSDQERESIREYAETRTQVECNVRPHFKEEPMDAEEQPKAEPWWGLKPPEAATCAWGARAIHNQRNKKQPLDFLPDRQSVSGARIRKSDFTVVLNELKGKVKKGDWYTDEIKECRSFERADMFYSFRVAGGYVYCLIYVKPLAAQL